jgi:hypothetical protein
MFNHSNGLTHTCSNAKERPPQKYHGGGRVEKSLSQAEGPVKPDQKYDKILPYSHFLDFYPPFVLD